jgi:dipeptidyl aminopeptidase/acylaminoacyl peptidase
MVPNRGMQAGKRGSGRAAGWLLWLLALLLAFPAAATAPVLGELPALGADQGLLVVAVDSPVPVAHLELRGRHWWQPRLRLRELEAGRALALYVVRAGRYRWQSVRGRDGVHYEVGDDPEYHFEVRAGAITYPGDLVFRPRGSSSAVLHVANRALGVIDALDLRHPGWQQQFVLAYSGRYPDPFPAFYQQQRAAAAAPPAAAALPARRPLPVDVATLWRAPRLEQVSLGPAGDRLAKVVATADGWRLELVDLHDQRSQALLESPAPIRSLAWSGDARLVVSVASRGPDDIVSVYHFDRDGGHERLALPRQGRVVDALPASARELLFASRVDGRLAVHRLDIGDQAALDASDFGWRGRLNLGIDGDLDWLADGHGRLRAGHAADARGASVLYHDAGGRFAEVLRVQDEHGFQPVRLSADGSLIYGLSEEGRAQRELVTFDPASGAVATVYARPGTDIVAPVFDVDRRLIGASYFEHGHLATEWFDATDRELDAKLRAAFPGRSIALLDRDRSGRQQIIAVEGAEQPTLIFHVDRDRDRIAAIDSSRPWLDDLPLAPAHLVQARGRDGLGIEAYLVLPAGERPRPLVVMPHGGPIGVRNQRTFDPEVQFLASLGYAVLQVNFRGSAGFGRAFREAGHGELGTGIEDDIDAAIEAALAAHPLDRERMCMLGASYGGYSALMGALRWPGRFRCAAAVAGFSDRVLQFTASDSGRSAEVRRMLETFMGDPNRELDAMLDTSPLYRFRELELPILLAHGTEDFRVDFEHTRRLSRMLALAGRPPVLVPLYGEGHTIESPHNRERLWQALADFLALHLGRDAATPMPGAEAVPDPATDPPRRSVGHTAAALL